ncbi:hypothetical protein MMC19_004696 [Ptychographa xylographoides]|nr:hypothetical protein [Ptychographa xylographoides]
MLYAREANWETTLAGDAVKYGKPALKAAGHYAAEYAPVIANSVAQTFQQNQQQQQQQQRRRRDPNWESTLATDAVKYGKPAAKKLGHYAAEYAPIVANSVAQTWQSNQQQQQQQQQQMQRRMANWESTLAQDAVKYGKPLAHEAGHLAAEYAPVIANSVAQTFQSNQQQQQQQQQQQRRDPKWNWQTVKHDAGVVAHDAGKVAEAAAPLALQYGPDLLAAAAVKRDLEALDARDPNFWHTLKHDAGQAAHVAGQVAQVAGPLALQYAPDLLAAAAVKRDLEDSLAARDAKFWHTVKTDFDEYAPGIVQAVSGHVMEKQSSAAVPSEPAAAAKVARDLDLEWAEGFLERRFAEAEAEADAEEIYAREADAEAEAEADAEADFEEIYARFAQPETEGGVEYEALFARDAEPQYYGFEELYLLDY